MLVEYLFHFLPVSKESNLLCFHKQDIVILVMLTYVLAQISLMGLN